MALSFQISTISRKYPPLPHLFSVKKSTSRFIKIECMAIATPCEPKTQTIVRRDANYQPSIWQNDYIQSLPTQYQGDTYKARADRLKEEVRDMLNKVDHDPIGKLELVETLQRLGIYYHFEQEINSILQNMHNSYSTDTVQNQDLYATSLKFRLLRQHNYDVPQDIFKSFMDVDQGKFKSDHSTDTKAMLYLYEASYLSTRGEKIMDEAREFSSKHLKEYVEKSNDSNDFLEKLVNHALELPLHWRVGRLEARWFIETYENKEEMNPTLLQLAKLDYNMVQGVHLEDLKYVSRWWSGEKVGKNLPFVRDRLLANFLWTIDGNFRPELTFYRRHTTKANSFFTVVDDVYDVYGTLDELRIFTDVISRWDVNAIDQLPEYMQILCSSLFNSINGFAYHVLTEQHFNILPHLKKAWATLCKCYMLEAEWFHNGYIPTLDEYLDISYISISAPAILCHSYSTQSNPVSKAGFEFFESHPEFIRSASTILRLADDLGTSTAELERGDNLKSIQCYMHETGVSEEKAREHIHYLISETWKKMNEERVMKDYPFNQTFVDTVLNISRTAQCMYLYGDSHAIELEAKDRILALLVNPIPLE